MKLSAYYEDYGQDLEKAVKKNTDTLTRETAVARVKELNLPGVLAAEKVPLFYKDSLPVAKADEPATKKPKTPNSSSCPRTKFGVSSSRSSRSMATRGDRPPPTSNAN